MCVITFSQHFYDPLSPLALPPPLSRGTDRRGSGSEPHLESYILDKSVARTYKIYWHNSGTLKVGWWSQGPFVFRELAKPPSRGSINVYVSTPRQSTTSIKRLCVTHSASRDAFGFVVSIVI